MTAIASLQPTILGKMNERLVLRVLQAHGPLSRAEVARRSGLSAPTVSKAVGSLLQAGLLEESEAAEPGRGRPARQLRLARSSTQVLGVVIDADCCQVVAAGLDGQLRADCLVERPTPATYGALLDLLEDMARSRICQPGVASLGLGLSLPGLIDYRRQVSLLSPNVPITNGQSPGRDLAQRLGLECVMLQESHALCLAEQHYGLARGLQDFAMLDVHNGVGLGVMSGGRLLTGHRGLAGEIGHIPLEENGRACGCGRRGCLETVASDSALAWRVSRQLGRPVRIDEVLALARQGGDFADALHDTCRHLAVAAALVINLFNPSTLFVHGRLFEADEALFGRMVEMARERTLPPSFADCAIVQARGRKPHGAVAGIIQHLTSAIAPRLETPDLYFPPSRQGEPSQTRQAPLH